MPKREYPFQWERGAAQQKMDMYNDGVRPISDDHKLLLDDVNLMFERIKAMKKKLRHGKSNKVLVDDAIEAWRNMAVALMSIRKPERDGTD